MGEASVMAAETASAMVVASAVSAEEPRAEAAVLRVAGRWAREMGKRAARNAGKICRLYN